jgi:formylglycine-generating enzyme required for sulfatase activity
MNGNAYQWILEDFDESGQGCLRGGSWPDEQEESINISNRFPSSKDTQGQCFGMRCVIAPVNTVSDIRTTRLPN